MCLNMVMNECGGERLGVLLWSSRVGEGLRDGWDEKNLRERQKATNKERRNLDGRLHFRDATSAADGLSDGLKRERPLPRRRGSSSISTRAVVAASEIVELPRVLVVGADVD
jgi:hypothetical protein